ncbi:hypothetical protein SAMN05216276_11643 [Streptosporangium subroseum]|uniref:Uncharacterized protein n=1 Tax=Streptosporangium subroseum TaxID=106412 RepID=A0A239PEN8_9ACTN|nr:hypothetical protein SAMN05216276_11643 [Streptosporangium subroseum]
MRVELPDGGIRVRRSDFATLAGHSPGGGMTASYDVRIWIFASKEPLKPAESTLEAAVFVLSPRRRFSSGALSGRKASR